MKSGFLMTAAACWLFATTFVAAAPPTLREGDIVFSSSVHGRGAAIRAATGSTVTHCGIVFSKNGELMVLEAAKTVGVIPLEKFLARCERGTFTARRLKQPLAPTALKSGRDWAAAQVGKAYDHRYLWSDDAIYCSELVWKIYKRAGVELCKPRQFKDFHLDKPEVKKDIEEQFGSIDKLPREEKVVAPSDLFASPMLEEIPANP
jgi:hypothetical protein